MERVLALAERLGKLIAETAAYQALRKAEAAVRADTEAGESVKRLHEAEVQIATKESEGKPIEPEEKHRLAELRDAVHDNEALQALAKAQADYMAIMNQVNKAIRDHLETGGTDA